MDTRTYPARNVTILAFEGAQLLDVAGPADVFEVASRELAQFGKPPAYSVKVAARSLLVRTSSGLRLNADFTLDQLVNKQIDTLLVAGGHTAFEEAQRPENRAYVSAVAAKCRRIGAVCMGAWLLAGAGLLDGRRATTHWMACEALAKTFPKVLVNADAIFVNDGPVWTSAGVTSGIDLALAMVEADHGRELALRVARLLVVYLKRPGGQSQYSAPLAAQMAERSAIRSVQIHAIERPADDLSVDALAARAAMSARNFARLFAQQTGMTPGDFVERIRLDAARRLLEESNLTAEQVALRCGFGGPDTLRRAFMRRLGVTPSDYRLRFCSETRFRESNVAET